MQAVARWQMLEDKGAEVPIIDFRWHLNVWMEGASRMDSGMAFRITGWNGESVLTSCEISTRDS